MGILKKIFGGKKKSKNEDGVGAAASTSFPSTTSSVGRRGKESIGISPSAASISTNGTNTNKPYSINTYRYTSDSPRSIMENSPRSSTGPVDTDDEGVIPPDAEDVDAYYEKVRHQTQDELRIAYEISKAQNKQDLSLSGDEKSANANSSGEHDSLSSSPRLTSNKLQQWDRKTIEQQPNHLHQQFSSSASQTSSVGNSLSQQQKHKSNNAPSQPQRIYSMSSALPSRQQMNMLDDTNQSESDASSFNLSTDAEDSEYEMMKHTTMRYPPGNLNGLALGLSALDTSAIDTVGSVTSYTTDQDSRIFPNLPTDDEMTVGTEASSNTGQQMPPSLLMKSMANPLQGSQVTVPDRKHKKISSPDSTHATNPDTSNASNASPNTSVNTSNDSSIIKTNIKNRVNPSWTNFANDPANQPTSTKNTSRNKPGAAPRSFTTPKSMASANTDFSNEGFGGIRKSSDGKTNDSIKDSSRNNLKDTIHSSDDAGFTDFGNFADFSGFPSTTVMNTNMNMNTNTNMNMNKEGGEWATVKEEKKDQSSWEQQNMEFFNSNKNFKTTKSNSTFGNRNDDPAWRTGGSSPSANDNNSHDRIINDPFHVASSAVGTSYVPSASPGFQSAQDTSLAELLEAAKSKRKDRRSHGSTRHHRVLSSSSVNSAPAITSTYLRQHHNLGSNRHNDITGDDMRYGTVTSSGNSYANNYVNGDRLGADETPISDIIQNLEATDRMKRGGQITSHRSMGDVGVVATARAAKERIRERRRREREAASGRNSAIRHSTSRDHSDSDESEGQKISESWLFDQVTDAIGPVGIAADLESLSGRSNRSKNSHGAKSHSLRRRSSRKTGSRRHRSDRSVDSHGSRTSRYSHRSTKSFLSQMSEQSRSVANDLLRLEMQLAMVGNNKDADGLPAISSSARISSGASLGGGSRASARSAGRKSSSGISSRHANTSSSVVRRSRTTIVAPPGKLGIILANKADSKGTVVSGVRTSSVLVDRISPGDRIVAIDGEDVSRMTVSEITTIMSRKAEYERRLTVLTATVSGVSSSEMLSPTHSRSSPRAMSVGGGGYGGDYSGTGSLGNYRR